MRHQHAAQVLGTCELRAIAQRAGRAHGFTGKLVALAVLADGVEVLQRKAQRIHQAMAGETARILRMLLERSRKGVDLPRRPPPRAPTLGGPRVLRQAEYAVEDP